MSKFKPGQLVLTRNCFHPPNNGRVLELTVIDGFRNSDGRIVWRVKDDVPPLAMFHAETGRYMFHDWLVVEDIIVPINDPGLDVETHEEKEHADQC